MRAVLEHRMVARMKRADLIDRNILKRGEGSAELMGKQQSLQRARIHSRLARTFRTRPTFEDLKEANIVPVVGLSPGHLDVQKKLFQKQRAQLLEQRLARRPSVDMLRGGEIMPFVPVNARLQSDDDYLAARVFPALEPALAALLMALEKRADQRARGIDLPEINPLNWLAERLMRTASS
eukprot:c11085_g1_i1.p1 GENE.c11085_g1_i1~~c11085_g1_i1.p1  ORF type:complete len:180 (+),score=36.15 c11085_g1_i1:436-975(+)